MSKVSLWRIVPQIIRRRGQEFEVNVKMVKCRPVTDSQTNHIVDFAPLKEEYWPWQVLIQRANWHESGDVWRVQWNPNTGYYRIVKREWYDPVDPKSRHWKGLGHTIRRVEELREMSLERFMDELGMKVKDAEFEGLVLGTLHSGKSQSKVA